ncbi:MAG: hypothetical protein U0625_04440 [Phycisphaerales bacterium]
MTAAAMQLVADGRSGDLARCTLGHPRIGDQAFISDYLVKSFYLPCAFRDSVGPDAVLSYKHDRCELGPRPGTAVVSFHGRPKPCDFTTGWVADAWK